MRAFAPDRPLRLAVRTSPSHGENTSSILVGVTSVFNDLAVVDMVQTKNIVDTSYIDAGDTGERFCRFVVMAELAEALVPSWPHFARAAKLEEVFASGQSRNNDVMRSVTGSQEIDRSASQASL